MSEQLYRGEWGNILYEPIVSLNMSCTKQSYMNHYKICELQDEKHLLVAVSFPTLLPSEFL